MDNEEFSPLPNMTVLGFSSSAVSACHKVCEVIMHIIHIGY